VVANNARVYERVQEVFRDLAASLLPGHECALRAADAGAQEARPLLEGQLFVLRWNCTWH